MADLGRPKSRRRWMTDKMLTDPDEEARLMGEDDVALDGNDVYPRTRTAKKRNARLLSPRVLFRYGFLLLILIGCIILLWRLPSVRHRSSHKPGPCTTVADGYICAPEISHKWGQYSPYHRVQSGISPEIPKGCRINLAQLLSRHGARDPTLRKTTLYARTIGKIKSQVPPSDFKGPYAFLRDYVYDLGADQLTPFGEQQMIDSGLSFFAQYPLLSANATPFIRASDQQRVVESAQLFAQGFHTAKLLSTKHSHLHTQNPDPTYPYPILLIPETPTSNNTLSPRTCPAFTNSPPPPEPQIFLSTFLPPIHARLSSALPTANLTLLDTLSLMDLCPFETVSRHHTPSPDTPPTKTTSKPPPLSPFCALFPVSDWTTYNYHQTLSKHQTHGAGHSLGPTQGVGYVNELIARLTGLPVRDSTSVNHTLDADHSTFPLPAHTGQDPGAIYADFTHDNSMVSIFAAMGLYNGSMPDELATGRVMSAEQLGGYGMSEMVPFAGRAVVEKMWCDGGGAGDEGKGAGEWVRVMMNGRVLPLRMCGGDEWGRCRLEAFVEGLGFARGGGRWEECFR